MFELDMEDADVIDEARREPVRDPQDLERLFIVRQWAGDLDGMLALYEPNAIVEVDDGQVLRGKEAIRSYFGRVISSGKKYRKGEQRPALITGDLALTSTRSPDGDVTIEVARRQNDGTWLWVIDRFSVA